MYMYTRIEHFYLVSDSASWDYLSKFWEATLSNILKTWCASNNTQTQQHRLHTVNEFSWLYKNVFHLWYHHTPWSMLSYQGHRKLNTTSLAIYPVGSLGGTVRPQWDLGQHAKIWKNAYFQVSKWSYLQLIWTCLWWIWHHNCAHYCN